MEVGARNTMEGGRGMTEGSSSQSTVGSVPTSTNTCNNLPLDDARSVAMETTPNPLSYWPPPSSNSPSTNSSKETDDGSQNRASVFEHSDSTDSFRNPSAAWNAGPTSAHFAEKFQANKNSDPKRTANETPSSLRTSYHNLPPIAAITSSHNYRGVREAHKHAQANSSGGESSTKSCDKPAVLGERVAVQSTEIGRSLKTLDESKIKENAEINGSEEKSSLERSNKTNSEVQISEFSSRKSEPAIREQPETSSAEQSSTSDAEYVFSMPSTVNVNPNPKNVASPRAPTPFTHPNPSGNVSNYPQMEAPTLNVNPNSNLSSGSPSPSNRIAPSPHFVAPSPTASRMPTPNNANVPSPSENPRIQPSPRPSVPSPSNVHRVPSSPHLNAPSPSTASPADPSASSVRVPSSPNSNSASFPQMNPPSLSDRFTGRLPYDMYPSNASSYINSHRSNANNGVSQERYDMNQTSKEPQRSNLPNRTGTSQPNTLYPLPSRNVASADSHSCRNPFELPVSKTYQQVPQQPQHHPQQQQQQLHFPYYHNNRNLPDPNKTDNPFRDNQMPENGTYYGPGFSQVSQRTNEKEAERQHYDASYKRIPGFQTESTQYDQRNMNQPRAETHQRDYVNFAKQSNFQNNRTNVWNKPDASEINHKNSFLNSQNSNKSNYSVNDYVNSNFQKQEHQSVSSNFNSSHFNVGANNDKQNCSSKTLNQSNSLSQRFPPVPQSNYDLNRQIYDRMTGVNQPVLHSSQRTTDKRPLHIPTNVTGFQPSKNSPYYRDYPNAVATDQDKSKNYPRPTAMKQNEYQGRLQPRSTMPQRPNQDHRSNHYNQYNYPVDKVAHDVYQNKKIPTSTNQNYHGYGSQSDAIPQQQQQQHHHHHHQPPVSLPEHHRSVNQNCMGNVNSVPHIPQSSYHNVSSDRSRPAYSVPNQSSYPPKLPHDYDSKKSIDSKGIGFPFANPQNVQQVPPQTINTRSSSTVAPHARPKRESPLDLSVKTVRQSADSTAKDDNDVYMQNYRNLVQNQNTLDNRYAVTQSNSNGGGAPKIDFTPNFSGFHADPNVMAQQRSGVPSALPPVESFKKTSPSKLPNQESKIPTSYAVLPQKYSSPTTQKVTNQLPEGRYEQSSMKYPDAYRSEAQKRPTNDSSRAHFSQPKIPKIDAWKVAMDQQIEQRLNSARISQQQSEKSANGVDPASKLSWSIHREYATLQSARHSGNHLRNSNMYPQTPVQTSATPYNPSSYVPRPHCRPATPQTPQNDIPHRENVDHSPDPEQIIKQISKGVMPDHNLLQDKKVVSILRSSLEEKEAKLMQLREVARRKEKRKESISPDGSKKPCAFAPYDAHGRIYSQVNKQCLPPFGAISLERMCVPPSFPGHKLNVLGPIDTVKIDVERTRNYLGAIGKGDAEKIGIPVADPSPRDEAQGPPDLDGLAAFLAARIRTKAELKQVGPTSDQFRAPSSRSVVDGKPILNETLLEDPSGRPRCSTTGSPPKLMRENRLLPPLRRRSNSHTDGDPSTTSAVHPEEQNVRSRDPASLRSSSETSVFDFRESDSEGEMPVLERQTLEGMRRDRKTFGSKQNVSTTTPEETVESDKPEPERVAELEASEPDPFWDTAFDMFVEELQKRPPKRSVRKKKCGSRPSDKDKFKSDADSAFEETKVIKTEIKDGEGVVKIEREENVREENNEKVNRSDVSNEESTVGEVGNDLSAEVRIESDAEQNKKDPDEESIKRQETKSENEIKVEVVEEPDEPKSKKISETGKKSDSKIKRKKPESRNLRTTRKTSSINVKSEGEDHSDSDLKSDSESTTVEEDDDDSLSTSGLESESSDSETSDTSDSDSTSSEEEEEEDRNSSKRIQTRFQTRNTKQRTPESTGMKLRSKAAPIAKTTFKKTRKRKRKKKQKMEYYSCDKKKKPSFGDGSDFRPGWEEECYKFKQQLRMPEKLINISRPSKRASASLPDLDPYRNSPSLSLDSSDVCLNKKSGSKNRLESDNDTDSETKEDVKKEDASSRDSYSTLTSVFSSKNGRKSSKILNMLVNKYGKGGNKKKDLKLTERKSPRIMPKATDKPELLPTPSLGIGKENVLKDKKNKESGKKKFQDAVYLGYFRQKTVNNFKEAFKQKGELLPNEFSPVILKSRTRTQTKVLKKRATLLEVFGEERPASAPPLTRPEETTGDREESPSEKRKPKAARKVGGRSAASSGMMTRGRGKLRSNRPGLRSAALLRSNKAVQISKRHLNCERRKRNLDLFRMRAMTSKKFSDLAAGSEDRGRLSLPMTEKRLKLRSVRRKFRSGFDYIRKKKKSKKDGDSVDGSVKEKRTCPRANCENIEDIQAEMKSWVINKGLGETVLHRAARLGYTDVVAYCLEKMDCSPSPRDNAGYTPLHEACSRGHLDVAKLLLMYGASVSESAKGGIRPLHEAAENGFTELIRLLLSYGADPLLETYTGHTALSLVTDEEARRLIQHHLADVQGNVAPVWTFQGPASIFDAPESGHDPLCDPPSPESIRSELELEIASAPLPPLYRLQGEPENERWVLLRDLASFAKCKSRDAVLKRLAAESAKEMKSSDFLERGKCCDLLSAGERPITKASKVVLIKYDEKVRQLLAVERVLV